jgi:hydrogenase maturation protease
MDCNTLVIGFGNRWRCDDGLGPAAADAIQLWQIPGVRVVTVQQLVPELIDEIKWADLILFVDAMVGHGSAFATTAVTAANDPSFCGHHQSPASLLALLQSLEGCAPEAWLLQIAAHSFEHGDRLTNLATANLQAALAWARHWLANEQLPRMGLHVANFEGAQATTKHFVSPKITHQARSW